MKRSTLSRSRRCSSVKVRSIFSCFAWQLFHLSRSFDRGMKTGGIDHHSEFLQIMRMAELMQRERLLDRGRLTHDVDRPVDRFLGQLQREGGFGGDPLRQ